MRSHSQQVVLALLGAGLLVGLAPHPVAAHYHPTSKIRYAEYSQDAFERARREGKPIFMVLSAVWCYWCKTYKEEALETPAVSLFLNQHFVPIFVDHDRRVDLARRFSRGLPTTVLMDPEGQVRHAFSGFLTADKLLWVLTKVKEEVATTKAAPITRPRHAGDTEPSLPPTPDSFRALLERLDRYLEENLDPAHGGFGTRRKHPRAWFVSYLLGRYAEAKQARYLDAARRTLDGVARGLSDPAEGGFFRFSGTRDWRDPHTEKLSPLNASLGLAMLEASRLTGEPRYRETADKAFGYLLRSLHDSRGGGFFGSQAASKTYYRLSLEERRRVAPPSVNRIKYAGWNGEVAYALLLASRATGREDLRTAALRSLDFLRQRLVTGRGVAHLYDPETNQPWLYGQLEANAWVSLALLEGYGETRRPEDLQAAREVLRYALSDLFDAKRGAFVEWNNPDPSLLRAGEQRSPHFPLEANGVMAVALLHAHRHTGEATYLQVARRVLEALSGQVAAGLSPEPDETGGAAAGATAFLLRAFELIGAHGQGRG
jgi:uncharacterized protein YyaL (SSP411 family)